VVILWVDYPELGLSEALRSAHSALPGYELATFDVALARAPGVTAYMMQ
jgi:hypothetical protein